VQPAVGGLADHNLPVGPRIGIPCYGNRIKVTTGCERQPDIARAEVRPAGADCQWNQDPLPVRPYVERDPCNDVLEDSLKPGRRHIPWIDRTSGDEGALWRGRSTR
jgi:hypothetical protein